ncbi:MAG: hypothetical protein Q8R76_00355 [Candidatus Omnitrophota bacterium]|nr:hypothetical protein [Candidatus Omnitrophota bacterium]
MTKFLIRIVAVLFLLGGGVLTTWLFRHAGFKLLEATGPFLVVVGIGLLLLRRWAAVCARVLCAVMAGFFICAATAIMIRPPGWLEFDLISAIVIILAFALPCYFLSRPAVLQHFE